jgi:sulfatase maturation enzyme AslB (radical SAM superfamily)
MNILLNPKYVLKADENRALLLTKDIVRAREDERIESVIHPVHAIILSFCTGEPKDICIQNASKFLGVSITKVTNFVDTILDNKAPVKVKYNDKNIIFPSETIILTDQRADDLYDPNIFLFDDIDLRIKRHKTVTDLTLMITTKCETDCIYCYASKHRSKEMDINIILKLIDEAKFLGVRSFDIIGGDIFAYKRWKEVIARLYSYGFKPYLSTKIPLDEESVKYLKSIGVEDIQVSLDTLIESNLRTIVKGGRDYKSRIEKMLYLLNKYDVKTNIHTIICSTND